MLVTSDRSGHCLAAFSNNFNMDPVGGILHPYAMGEGGKGANIVSECDTKKLCDKFSSLDSLICVQGGKFS